MSNIFELYFLNRIDKTLTGYDFPLKHEFGFRREHSTIHRAANNIKESLESKGVCRHTAVWQVALLYTWPILFYTWIPPSLTTKFINLTMPSLIITSYNKECHTTRQRPRAILVTSDHSRQTTEQRHLYVHWQHGNNCNYVIWHWCNASIWKTIESS